MTRLWYDDGERFLPLPILFSLSLASREARGAFPRKEKFLKIKDLVWTNSRLREFLSSGLFFCLLVGLDVLLRMLYQGAAVTRFLSPIPWSFTLSWALLLTALVRLLPQRGQRIAMGVLGSAFSLLFLTHALLARAKGTFFSFSILIFAGDGFKFLDPSYLQVRKLVWIGFFCEIGRASCRERVSS